MKSDELEASQLGRINELVKNGSCCPAPLSAERFDQTHEAFESRSDQQSRILAWLDGYIGSEFATRDPLRILSVGCGSGILDTPLISSLSQRFDRIEYAGVDPNRHACARFRTGFDQLGLDNATLDLREQSIEDVRCQHRFDLILAVHSLYYVSNPASTLESLVSLLVPDGSLVVFQAPKGQLNQLSDCFWMQHQDREIWFSDRLTQHCKDHDWPYLQQRIDAAVDVGDCFRNGTSSGQMMLDFITQSNVEGLDAQIMSMCREYLRTICRYDAGRQVVAHPVDVFSIRPASPLSLSRPSNRDTIIGGTVS